jgi:hypothetical protein
MAVTVGELIRELQEIADENGPELVVITDQDVAVAGAEYNVDGGDPACVIVTE